MPINRAASPVNFSPARSVGFNSWFVRARLVTRQGEYLALITRKPYSQQPMASKFDSILLDAYEGACTAYLELMKDGGATTKMAFGKSYTREGAAALRDEIVQQEKYLEGRGMLPINLRSSKIGVMQALVVEPRNYYV